ncbi:MAG: hypothetical protein RR808_06035 [Akkermansia sp.]
MKYLILLSSLLTISPLLGQVYTPPSQQAPPAQSADSSPNAYTQAPKAETKSLYGNELPFVDPHDETITINGKSFALGDNRVMAARFEKYLNEPEDSSEEALEYRKTIDELLQLISPKQIPHNVISKAVALLARASSYPGDAKLCDTLIQVVYTSRLSQKGQAGRQEAISSLEQENKRLVNSMSFMISTSSHISTVSPGTKDANQKKVQAVKSDPKYLASAARLAEIVALKKKYEGEAALSLVEAKIVYQAALVHLFMQKRFQHVVIGARLYNHIFKDGDTKMKLEKGSDADKLFGSTMGVPPTVASLDSLANEAIRDSERHIQAIRVMLNNKNLLTGAKRLSEAYLLGEFLPAVTTFPLTEKQKVNTFLRDSYKLISSIDAKDYTGASDLIKKLHNASDDFDSVKADSAIAAYTRASDMHLFNAKQAFMTGDKTRAESEIKQAIEIWPRNPKLDELDKTMLATNDIIIAKQDFERHLAEKNYRQIFAEQYRFAPVIQGDPKLEDAFKQIIGNIMHIETAIAKSVEFSKMGQDFAAWEELKELRENPTFAQDPELGKQIEELMPRVSELTLALDKGRKSEEMKEPGSALAWYLKARHIYPNSKFATNGINRILNSVLPASSSKE